jgi:DNA-binding NtrC family response regulator
MEAPLDQNVVWIADGDAAVRSALKFALELEGLTVHTCASGAELLRHLAMAKADCIVLDYKMSQSDDLADVDRLRLLCANIPVILIVNVATDRVRHLAARAGVYRILEKPLFDNVLLTTIEEILSQRRTRG